MLLDDYLLDCEKEYDDTPRPQPKQKACDISKDDIRRGIKKYAKKKSLHEKVSKDKNGSTPKKKKTLKEGKDIVFAPKPGPTTHNKAHANMSLDITRALLNSRSVQLVNGCWRIEPRNKDIIGG